MRDKNSQQPTVHQSLKISQAWPMTCKLISSFLSGSLLTLQGAGAYDAAVHCASVSAARRIMQHQITVPAASHFGPAVPSAFGGRASQQQLEPRTVRPMSAGSLPRDNGRASSSSQEEASSRRTHGPNMFQKVPISPSLVRGRLHKARRQSQLCAWLIGHH